MSVRVAMKDQAVGAEKIVQKSEREFYSAYDWCLNPIQTVRDLFVRLTAELDRYSSLSRAWERAEVRITLYLLICAIACSIDDYLSWDPFVLTPVADDYPKFASAFMLVQGILNFPYALRSVRRIASVSALRNEWRSYVDRMCSILLSDDHLSPEAVASLKSDFRAMGSRSLPEDFLRRKMKLNEGYRCQDLTHHDVLALTDRFIQSNPATDTNIVVIGPRTAGAYFAPLVKCHLQYRGYQHVSWITLRPKRGLSRAELTYLRHNLNADCRVIITDDYSNTGNTFRKIQKIILRYGVSPKNITLLAPLHPTQPVVKLTVHPETKVLALQHKDLFKNSFLNTPSAVEPLLQEYLGETGGAIALAPSTPDRDRLNAQFELHYRDSFQVRLKKVYDVEIRYPDRPRETRRVLAKSVGWGWLGYHAFIAGTRLSGSVPNVLGLRNGFLFTEWVDGRPWSASEVKSDGLEVLSSYIVRRATQLRLERDPRFRSPDTGWGWLEILRLLRQTYGDKIGRLKQKALHENLRPLVSPVPSLVDGRMRPDEWLLTATGLTKTDFEHHNFGAPEFDIVDPAYDLAATTFEFQLSPEHRDSLIQSYTVQTGDAGASDRVLMYQLLYGTLANRFAREGIVRNRPFDDHEALHQRQLRSWNFLVFTMAHFSSGLVKPLDRRPTNGVLVSMDIDGVLDSEVMGFPHPTTSSIYALALLRYNGFTVIPNTGRSIEHVRAYCRLYGFIGGIAEYGGVYFDARDEHEQSLLEPDAVEQLAACREALKALPGVFLDSGYQYAVRALRYNAKGTVGLTAAEAEGILKSHKLDKLAVIVRGADTYFVGAKTSKGAGILHAKARLGGTRLVAIGDSQEDLSMFEVASQAFAPANCSSGIRMAAKSKGIHIVADAQQRGLLAATRLLLKNDEVPARERMLDKGKEHTFHALLYSLLSIAERSRVERTLAALDPFHP
ncbi:MAG TPA: hypothetical protein VMG09_04305 [Bacteroidota bacterium]|nr:hypothetical protein [Bacteroidota bacterium]